MSEFFSLHRRLLEKHHVNKVKKVIVNQLHGHVLDVGCGNKKFYNDVKNQVKEYIGLDHPETLHNKEKIDVFATAYDIPFNDESFDFVLLTQVLEHLEEPKKALKEVNRVLKKDGKLIISWPFLYPIHEAPRDFYRYTHYGIRHLGENSGFKIEKIQAVSGFWVTIFGFISIYLIRKSKVLYLLLFPILIIIKYICILLEWIDRNPVSKEKWTWNYYAVMIKNGN